MKLEMLTEGMLHELKTIFQSYDFDGSGILSKNELNRFFRSMGKYFSNQELYEALDIIDNNNDGQVSFQEFIQFVLEDE